MLSGLLPAIVSAEAEYLYVHVHVRASGFSNADLISFLATAPIYWISLALNVILPTVLPLIQPQRLHYSNCDVIKIEFFNPCALFIKIHMYALVCFEYARKEKQIARCICA